MKKHFYKIPVDDLEKILDKAAFKADLKTLEFMLDVFSDREKYRITEDSEDEIEQRRRLPGLADPYILQGD